MGDPFLRAFLTIYDVEKKRLGLLNMSLPAQKKLPQLDIKIPTTPIHPSRFNLQENYPMLFLTFMLSLAIIFLSATFILLLTKKCCMPLPLEKDLQVPRNKTLDS
jgi:hypothetical protein